MIMRKKLIATMLLLGMALLMLTGCGKKENEKSNTSNQEAERITTSQKDEEYMASEQAAEEAAKAEVSEAEVYHYYYNQLTAEEKGMYDSILASKEELINNQPISVYSFNSKEMLDYSAIGEGLTRAYTACLLDNPEISMWINTFEYYMEVEKLLNEDFQQTGVTCNIHIKVAEGRASYGNFSTPEETRQAVSEVEAKSKEFVRTLEGLSDEEKAIQIHNWILEDAKYDSTLSHSNIRNLYGAIIQKECVCAGFAYGFKFIGDMAGIDTLIVSGKGVTPFTTENGSHAWNNICINGTWSLIDLTWDCNKTPIYEEAEETYVEGDRYMVSKTYTVVGTTYGTDYLFKPLEEAEQTHIASESFDVPHT